MIDNKFLKLILIFFILGLTISCKGQNNFPEINTSWFEVKKQRGQYIIIDCGYEGGWIRIKNDSITDHGIMEENTFKIKRFARENKSIYIYIDKKDKYEIFWVDKRLGIIKLVNGVDNNSVKYYVNKYNLKKIKKIKGSTTDCITSE